MKRYLPEGHLYETETNSEHFKSLEALEEAYRNRIILERKALLCTAGHDIIVDTPFGKGIIPREEGDISIGCDTSKDISLLTRVGKEVCFKIISIDKSGSEPVFILSRKEAQLECLREFTRRLCPGQIIPARVTHLEQFGAFVDIGCGISSLIPIDAISVSRISHPSDRFSKGQDIFAVVKGCDEERVYLSHKELLGSWQENADRFAVGETVTGIVRSVEDYGIFVELAPNLAGLAEFKEGVRPGQAASVYIKAMIPDKMKIKLIIVDSFESSERIPLHYFISSGSIKKWVYSTERAPKSIIIEF